MLVQRIHVRPIRHAISSRRFFAAQAFASAVPAHDDVSTVRKPRQAKKVQSTPFRPPAHDERRQHSPKFRLNPDGLGDKKVPKFYDHSFSPEGQELGRKIVSGEINATEYLQQAISEGTVTPEIIRACLSAQWLLVYGVERAYRPQYLQDIKIGSTVVDYIKQDEDNRIPLQLWHGGKEQRFHLCFFAVAEGLESDILKWIGKNFDTSKHSKGTVDNYQAWRGYLLGDLTRAILVNNKDFCADDGLQFLFDFIQKKDNAKVQQKVERIDESPETIKEKAEVLPLTIVSLWPATTSICNQLCSGAYNKTDPKLFERFQIFYGRYPGKGTKLSHDFGVAHLQLRHPTKPTEFEAMKFLNDNIPIGDYETRYHAFKERLGISGVTLRHFMDDARNLLFRKGRSKDAYQVERWTANLFGSSKFPRGQQGASNLKESQSKGAYPPMRRHFRSS